MAIPGAGLGIVRFEYSGNGVVVACRVEFMAVPVPSLGIPGLADIRGVRFEYSDGGGVAAGSGGRQWRLGHGDPKPQPWLELVLVCVVGARGGGGGGGVEFIGIPVLGLSIPGLAEIRGRSWPSTASRSWRSPDPA